MTTGTKKETWIAPIRNSDWNEVKDRVTALQLTVTSVDDKNHLIYTLMTEIDMNSLATERRLCCGYAIWPRK